MGQLHYKQGLRLSAARGVCSALWSRTVRLPLGSAERTRGAPAVRPGRRGAHHRSGHWVPPVTALLRIVGAV